MLSNGYILILIWVGVLGALAVMAPEWIYRTEFVNGEKVRRVTPLFAVVAVVGLFCGAGGCRAGEPSVFRLSSCPCLRGATRMPGQALFYYRFSPFFPDLCRLGDE